MKWIDLRGSQVVNQLPPTNVGMAIIQNGRWVKDKEGGQRKLRADVSILGNPLTVTVAGIPETEFQNRRSEVPDLKRSIADKFLNTDVS